MVDLRQIAKILGGYIVSGRQVLVPGPGHSPRDRSLSVTFRPDGTFYTHSFTGQPLNSAATMLPA